MDIPSDVAAAAADPSPNVRYWWVNHKRTHAQELNGEFLWSPKRKQSGADNESSNNMTKIMPGDVVFAIAALLMAWDFLLKLGPLYPGLVEWITRRPVVPLHPHPGE